MSRTLAERAGVPRGVHQMADETTEGWGMTVWMLEAGTDHEGHKVAGVYESAADALEAIALSRAVEARYFDAPGWDDAEWSACWLTRHDFLILSEMRMGETRTETQEPRAFESQGKGHHHWRSANEGNTWTGTADALLALVMPSIPEDHNNLPETNP